MRDGEVQFYRFPNLSGIFQFYLGKDGQTVQVDWCDDGIMGASTGTAGATAGVGQNYLWDRYPGEIEPDVPAHTCVVGMAGEPTGFGAAGDACSACAAISTPVRHHDCCDWEYGTCSCSLFEMIPPDQRRPNIYTDQNLGADNPHLRAWQGPLEPADAIAANCGTGLGQPASEAMLPASTDDLMGGTTITPSPDGGDVVTSTVAAPTSATPLVTTDGAVVPPPMPPAAPAAPAPTTALTAPASAAPATTAAAPATTTTTPTNTGMLVLGLVAVVAGLGGIAYLAHARTAGTAST